MSEDRELEELEAELEFHVRQAQRYRFDAAELLSSAERHEGVARGLREQIAELEE